MFNNNQLKVSMGEEICSQLLILLAFTGCESTSQVLITWKKKFQKVGYGGFSIHNFWKNLHCLQPNKIDCKGKWYQSCKRIVWGTYLRSPRPFAIFLGREIGTSVIVCNLRTSATINVFNQVLLSKICYEIMAWMGCEGDLKVGNSGWKVMNNKLVRVMTK